MCLNCYGFHINCMYGIKDHTCEQRLTFVGWEENVVSWPSHYTPIPKGYVVIQVDSGHYQGLKVSEDGGYTNESSQTVNRFHARQWTFEHAESNK